MLENLTFIDKNCFFDIKNGSLLPAYDMLGQATTCWGKLRHAGIGETILKFKLPKFTNLPYLPNNQATECTENIEK